jgi:O-acetylserine/cysteine efflux transporter
MKNTVDVLPPLMNTAMRFFLTLVPAVFFISKPKVSWTNLLGYGLSIGVVQFGCLYIAVDGLITPGLASLVVQMQVLFTIGMSIYINSERISAYQLTALILAALGLLIIALHTDNQTSLIGLALTLLAALGWASGNMFSKRAIGVNMLSYVVWSTLFSIPPLVCLSLYFEGPQNIAEHLSKLEGQTFFSVLWQAWGSTIFCYGIWGWLLARYTAITVAPFALLIPVFGMGASALVLNESLPLWKLEAAMLVIAAMLLNTFGAQLHNVLTRKNT